MAIEYTREYVYGNFRLRIDDDKLEAHFDDMNDEHRYLVTHVSKYNLWENLKKEMYDINASVSNKEFDKLWEEIRSKGTRTLSFAQAKMDNPEFTITVKRFTSKNDENWRDGRVGYVASTALPHFCDHGWTSWFNTWDEDAIKKAFYDLKNSIYGEAAKRKEHYKDAIYALEKMAEDAGFRIGSEKLDAFERVLEFESAVGEEKDLAAENTAAKQVVKKCGKIYEVFAWLGKKLHLKTA